MESLTLESNVTQANNSIRVAKAVSLQKVGNVKENLQNVQNCWTDVAMESEKLQNFVTTGQMMASDVKEIV